MIKKKIAINGFGRIGRAAFKIILDRDDMEIIAINDLTDTATLAHLLKYDSVYGKFNKEVKQDDNHLYVAGKKIITFSEKDPAALSWRSLDIDVVLECTGIFRTQELASLHLKAGAKAVIISAPAKDHSTPTYVLGVNTDKKSQENIISNASCTTNCIAPVAQIMAENFGIKKAAMTTIHSYTADQNLVDGPSTFGTTEVCHPVKLYLNWLEFLMAWLFGCQLLVGHYRILLFWSRKKLRLLKLMKYYLLPPLVRVTKAS